jgi:type I protein arginine methyltransferase
MYVFLPPPETWSKLTFLLVWDNVYGFDYTPLKESALTEPLVDTVDIKSVVTDPTPVLTLDLYTVTPEDLSFSTPFTLQARRDDFIHALIAWFDIDFTACHKPIRFSTGPHTKYTHWKQTVFYLRDVLTVQQDEKIQGVLTNKPNSTNKRDLDISIQYALEATDPLRMADGTCHYKMSVFLNHLPPRRTKIYRIQTNKPHRFL